MTPLALELLLMSMLARNTGSEAPGIPSSNSKEWEEAYTFGDAEGLVDGNGLTARGRAWLDMVHATPLPVQQWIDPRGTVDGLTHLVGKPVRVFAERDLGAVFTPTPALAAVLSLPAGFTPWAGTDPKGPNLNLPPQAMKPDVIVIWRDGKTRKGRPNQGAIASFNWAHTGGNDDICGWLVVREAEEHVTT